MGVYKMVWHNVHHTGCCGLSRWCSSHGLDICSWHLDTWWIPSDDYGLACFQGFPFGMTQILNLTLAFMLSLSAFGEDLELCRLSTL